MWSFSEMKSNCLWQLLCDYQFKDLLTILILVMGITIDCYNYSRDLGQITLIVGHGPVGSYISLVTERNASDWSNWKETAHQVFVSGDTIFGNDATTEKESSFELITSVFWVMCRIALDSNLQLSIIETIMQREMKICCLFIITVIHNLIHECN